MNDSDTGRTAQIAVRVRPGCQHPTLGAIGGWEGTLLRSFNAGGVTYVDLQVSEGTIAGLSGAERGRFYGSKIVFTRVRLPRSFVEPFSTGETPRPEVMARAQREWYDRIGSNEQDPTKFVADRAAPGRVDTGRRQALRSLVTIGATLMILLALAEQNCNNDKSGSGRGSWRRSGGFSS
jgi:hypothetical protein